MIFRSCLVLAVGALLAGCAATPPMPPVQSVPPVAVEVPSPSVRPVVPEPPPAQSYLVKPGDELDIHVAAKPELNQTTKVRPDGWITLPHIGSVRAAGRLPEDLQAEITRRYRELGGTPAAVPSGASYPISAGDLLEVKFVNHPELNQLQRVRPDGRISLSLVHAVIAQGKTPEMLETELLDRYGRFLKRNDLVVIVRESSSNRILVGGSEALAGFAHVQPTVAVKSYAPEQIFIGGEVQRPGVFGYRSVTTALQAILEAGGAKPSGEMRSVIVLRKGAGEEAKVMRIDLGSDLTANTTHDIYLRPNDMVIVPKTAIADVAEFLDQYLFQIIPPLRNSSFGFVYDMRGSTTTRIQTF